MKELRALRILARSKTMQLFTFGAIGIFNTIAFFVLANAFHSFWLSNEAYAAYLAYAVLLPASFMGHRRLTFRSAGPLRKEWIKFCVIQSVNFLIIGAVTSLSTTFPYIAGWPSFAIVSILIPLLNFCIFQVWVFAKT